MDRRVLIIRRWLLLIAAVILCACVEPGLWFCLFAAPIIWTKTSGGTTGILIHPDGPPWAIAVGDSEDATCECCGCTITCTRCLNNKADCYYELTIAGLGGGCDGTFLMGIGGQSVPTGLCQWNNSVGGVCQGGVWPILKIQSFSGSRRYTVETGVAFGTLFLKDIPGADGTNCLSLNESIPPTPAGGSATCQMVSASPP